MYERKMKECPLNRYILRHETVYVLNDLFVFTDYFVGSLVAF